jgi:hypothetical protein
MSALEPTLDAVEARTTVGADSVPLKLELVNASRDIKAIVPLDPVLESSPPKANPPPVEVR